jgi:hypothetical protein
MARLYGRAGLLTTENGGFRPGQEAAAATLAAACARAPALGGVHCDAICGVIRGVLARAPPSYQRNAVRYVRDTFWSARCQNWSTVTRAHVPRQVIKTLLQSVSSYYESLGYGQQQVRGLA